MLPNPWIIVSALVAFIFTAVGGFAYGGRVERLKWEAAIERQKTEAATLLAYANANALQKHLAYESIKDELEKTHAEKRDALNAVYADNRRLVDELGGLRDARGRQSCPAAVAASAKPARDAAAGAAGCQLSVETSRALLDLARDADAAADYAQTCRAWVMSLRAEAPP
jgi:hypothetical protein